MVKTDEELVAAGVMLVAELAKINKELDSRNVDATVLTYGNGDIKIRYERIVTTKLGGSNENA